MFPYYGAKGKILACYPRPKFDKIIEPFSGSARYSLTYFEKDVLLFDKYKIIVDIFKYLQNCSKLDILSLPDVNTGQSLNDFNLSYEEKSLIGFYINGGSASPKITAKDFNSWNKSKKIIANDLFKIKHWKIELDSYENIKNQKATWFIDPPYQYGGEYYVKSNKNIDFKSLGNWCKERDGQIIVCENTKADWLPFIPMKTMQGALHKTTESIWSNERTEYESLFNFDI